jgi:hypothetical protein
MKDMEMIQQSSMAPDKQYGDQIGKAAATGITNDIPVGFDHNRMSPEVSGGKVQS